MENTGANIKPTSLRTAALCSGSALGGVAFGLALLFSYRLTELVGVGGAVGLSLGSGLVSAGLMPLVYYGIKRTNNSFWGRYHFTLALCVILGALFTALSWNIGEDWFVAGKVIALCFFIPISVLSLTALDYIAFAAGVRLIADDKRYTRYSVISIAVGGAIGVGLSLLTLTGSIGAVGYGLGCLILLAGGIFYFSSVSALPRFVRPLSTQVSVRSVYSDFFPKGGVKAALAEIGYLLSCIAFVFAMGFSVALCTLLGLNFQTALTAAALFSAAGAVAFVLCVKKRVSEIFTLLGGAGALLSFTALALVTLLASLSESALTAMILAVYALAGFSLGMSAAAARISSRIYSAGKRAGIVHSRETLLFVLAAAFGIAFTAFVSALDMTAGIITFACIVVFLVFLGAAMTMVSVKLCVAKQSDDLSPAQVDEKEEEEKAEETSEEKAE